MRQNIFWWVYTKWKLVGLGSISGAMRVCWLWGELLLKEEGLGRGEGLTIGVGLTEGRARNHRWFVPRSGIRASVGEPVL